MKSFCSNSKQHEPKNKEEGELSNVSQFDRCASRGFGEHIESQGAPAAHDAGRHLHFVELRQPRTEKVEPWTGTHKGPKALFDVFPAIQRFWKTLDFKVTDTIEQGSRVAFFGSFTYKSNVTGKEITSPFGLLARFEGDKVAYVQFLEDSYGTAGSFKTGAPDGFTAIPLERG